MSKDVLNIIHYYIFGENKFIYKLLVYLNLKKILCIPIKFEYKVALLSWKIRLIRNNKNNIMEISI